MKILFTGATGFVGRNMTKYFLCQGHEVYSLGRESSDYSVVDSQVTKFFIESNSIIDEINDADIDIVIHLASLYIHSHVYDDIDALVLSNIGFGTKLLDIMNQCGIKRLINTGTSFEHYENQAYNPVNLYAATKQAFEKMIDFYVEAYDFKVNTIKLFDTYGTNDRRKKLIPWLMSMDEKHDEILMSPGDQEMSVMHIEDICRAFEVVLNSNPSIGHEKFMLKSKDVLSLKELVALIERIKGFKLNVQFGKRDYRFREVMNLWGNGKLIADFEEKWDLETGLKEMHKEMEK